MFYIFSCIILYLHICNSLRYDKGIEVKTVLGTIKGKLVEDDTTGACYYSFEGIPYAEAPVGDLRFKPPVQRRPCDTIIDATKPGHVCPQIEKIYTRREMSEDCLNLNIYTPANNTLTKFLPVIFYIHGGDYSYSSGNAKPIYGPQFFIENEIILVSINYRLGALGFLSLCTEEVSGNAGLKDVILALKIVHEIIWRFGGDSHKITLMGHGAGAAMVELLMLIKEVSGLYQSVILYSGSFLSSKYMQINPRENALLLGKELHLDLSNDECLDELKNVDPFDFIEAEKEIERKDPQRGARIFKPFKPVVEIECESAVLTKPPLELIREGEICDVPMIVGFSDQEGVEMFPLLKREPELIDKLNKNSELLIPADIKYPYGSVARRNLAARIREFYFDGGDICFTDVQNYVNLITDSLYSFSIDYMIELYTEKKKSPVYYYIFKADTELNWFKEFEDITYPGAAHSDKLGYVFLTSITKPKYECLDSATKNIQVVILQSIKYFLNNGIINPDPNFFPVAGRKRYHVIEDYGVTPIYNNPIPEGIGFWRSVYEEFFASKYNNATYFCSNIDAESIAT